MSRLKGAAANLFSTADSDRSRRTPNETHKCLIFPWGLHHAAVEIAFNEGIKLKDMMTIVIGKEVNSLENLTASAEVPHYFSFSSSEKFIHTSAFLPKDLISSLKKISHYSGINEWQIVANGLADYLLQEYGEKYPELVRQLENYKTF